MPGKKLKHTLFSKTERDYWKNLHVNVDSFCDKWEAQSKNLGRALGKFSDATLKEVGKHYKVIAPKKGKITESFLENQKASIDFYCVISFALINPKAVSQLYKIPIKSGVVDKVAVILKIFEEHKKKALPQIFPRLRKQMLGRGNFNFNFDEPVNAAEVDRYVSAMPLLARFLKRKDKNHVEYHYRSSSISDTEWIFLLLKETADVILPAITENTRVIKGDYIIITINVATNALEINTKSKGDAYKIKGYLSFKSKNKLTYKKKTANYNAVKFLTEIINEEQSPDKLIFTDADFRNTNLRKSMRISDPDRKNNIVAELHALKDKNVIKLEDLSEFNSLTFYYKGISFKVIIEENKWGELRLNLLDKGKPSIELAEFQKNFEEQFNIPVNVQLRNEDSVADLKRTTRKLFERNTIEAPLPEEVEDILLDLIKLKLADKPSKSAKRKCTQCKKMTWEKGDCPVCGNELVIEGDYIDLKPNIKGINAWLYQTLASKKEITTRKIKKQIDGASYQLIDVLDKSGCAISIFVTSSNLPDKIVKHYQETGSPLLVVLVRYKDALDKDIRTKGFECMDISDLYVTRDNNADFLSIISNAITSQKHKWQEKIIQKGYNSYQSLTNKPKGYGDQDFEKDIFNVLHELFLVGDRLGGKFAGVPAPDGIVSVQNYGKPMKRFCLSWDCKYSVTKSGYQLNDPADKHRKYIYSLKKNDKVQFYGGLSAYAIISQNMDMKRYESFYSKLTDGFRWKGHILFIEEGQVTKLYKFYKDNEALIQNDPIVFYSELYKLFKSIWKKDSMPYKVFSNERLLKLFEKVEQTYKRKGKSFVFDRSEF